jgi:hypothetical protein
VTAAGDRARRSVGAPARHLARASGRSIGVRHGTNDPVGRPLVPAGLVRPATHRFTITRNSCGPPSRVRRRLHLHRRMGGSHERRVECGPEDHAGRPAPAASDGRRDNATPDGDADLAGAGASDHDLQVDPARDLAELDRVWQCIPLLWFSSSSTCSTGRQRDPLTTAARRTRRARPTGRPRRPLPGPG